MFYQINYALKHAYINVVHINVASAEWEYLIYHFGIIILYHDYIYFNLFIHFTHIASAYDLKAFQIKCGLISIS